MNNTMMLGLGLLGVAVVGVGIYLVVRKPATVQGQYLGQQTKQSTADEAAQWAGFANSVAGSAVGLTGGIMALVQQGKAI